METWTILLTISLATFGIYLWHKMTYFKRIGILYCSPVPLFGNLTQNIFQQKHFFDTIKDLYNRWPETKYFGLYMFTEPMIVIRDPELIKSIGVKNFDSFTDHQTFFSGEETDSFLSKSLHSLKGDKWREVRQLLSPAFTTSKMKMMHELMWKCAADFAEYLINNSMRAVPDIEMKDVFTRYTNDVIATCAFGINVDSMRNPNNEFYVLGKKISNFGASAIFKFFIIKVSPYFAKLLKLQIFEEKVTTYFKSIIENTIKIREKEGIVRPDMLQLMMETAEKTNGKKLDIAEMTAQAFLFFVGGFDSTSSLMSFAATTLAIYPECQKKVQNEIDVILKETDGNPTYEAVNDMPYLEAVLHETLRLYPIGGILDRVCTSSVELPPALPGHKPFIVKPGMSICIPAIGIHHDPQYYTDPMTFNPERFLHKKVNVNQSTYLGFGIGPRSCIGNRFALLEAKLVFFHLLARCNFKLSEKTKVPLKFKIVPFTLVAEGGFWLHLELRKTNLIYFKKSEK